MLSGMSSWPLAVGRGSMVAAGHSAPPLTHPHKLMKSNFRDLLAWQKGMDLVDEIYRTVSCFPRHQLFALTAQTQRAALRPSDIAEGSGRWNLNDFRRFPR